MSDPTITKKEGKDIRKEIYKDLEVSENLLDLVLNPSQILILEALVRRHRDEWAKLDYSRFENSTNEELGLKGYGPPDQADWADLLNKLNRVERRLRHQFHTAVLNKQLQDHKAQRDASEKAAAASNASNGGAAKGSSVQSIILPGMGLDEDYD